MAYCSHSVCVKAVVRSHKVFSLDAVRKHGSGREGGAGSDGGKGHAPLHTTMLFGWMALSATVLNLTRLLEEGTVHPDVNASSVIISKGCGRTAAYCWHSVSVKGTPVAGSHKVL